MTATELLTELKALGVASVDVEYSGSGDEGWVNGVTAYRPPADPPGLSDAIEVRLPRGLTKELETTVDRLLEEYQAGWEINEGASGQATLTVATGAWAFDHRVNYLTTEHEPFAVAAGKWGDEGDEG